MHLNVYEPKSVRPVRIDPDGEGRPIAWVEITDASGSVINLWVRPGSEKTVAAAINIAVAPQEVTG